MELTVSTFLPHLPLASWFELEEDSQLGQSVDQGSQTLHHSYHGHSLPVSTTTIKHCLHSSLIHNCH